MPEPEETPAPVCDHDAKCPTCNTCTECYPHEPGKWVASGVTEPCRSACILKHLNDMDLLEQIVSEIADRSGRPRDQRHASHLIDDIRAFRDRMLGTGDL
jgi:hypothetical protein